MQRFTLPNGHPAWLVTGYAEVRAALTDARLVKAPIPAGTPARCERIKATPGITTHML